MRCSFCRRPDSKVAKLVAGPWRILAGRVYICDRCAVQTIQIMEAHSGDNGPRQERDSPLRWILNRLGRRREQDSHKTFCTESLPRHGHSVFMHVQLPG